jgi:hypothetical protein
MTGSTATLLTAIARRRHAMFERVSASVSPDATAL